MIKLKKLSQILFPFHFRVHSDRDRKALILRVCKHEGDQGMRVSHKDVLQIKRFTYYHSVTELDVGLLDPDCLPEA